MWNKFDGFVQTFHLASGVRKEHSPHGLSSVFFYCHDITVLKIYISPRSKLTSDISCLQRWMKDVLKNEWVNEWVNWQRTFHRIYKFKVSISSRLCWIAKISKIDCVAFSKRATHLKTSTLCIATYIYTYSGDAPMDARWIYLLCMIYTFITNQYKSMASVIISTNFSSLCCNVEVVDGLQKMLNLFMFYHQTCSHTIIVLTFDIEHTDHID